MVNGYDVMNAAKAFNDQYDALPHDDEMAMATHAEVISRYCDELPNDELREIFTDWCIMPDY